MFSKGFLKMAAKKKPAKKKPAKPLKFDLDERSPWIIPPAWYEVMLWVAVIIMCFVMYYFIH